MGTLWRSQKAVSEEAVPGGGPHGAVTMMVEEARSDLRSFPDLFLSVCMDKGILLSALTWAAGRKVFWGFAGISYNKSWFVLWSVSEKRRMRISSCAGQDASLWWLNYSRGLICKMFQHLFKGMVSVEETNRIPLFSKAFMFKVNTSCDC